MYYKVNIYISSCECTLYIRIYVCVCVYNLDCGKQKAFLSLLLIIPVDCEKILKFLLAHVFLPYVFVVSSGVRVCVYVWVHVCTLLTYEAIILVECF